MSYLMPSRTRPIKKFIIFENGVRVSLLIPFGRRHVHIVPVLAINSLRQRLNRHPFADDIFKCIFLPENEWILPRISLKFLPKVRINNMPALVQIMAWCRPGDKPLSEPMMVSLLTHNASLGLNELMCWRPGRLQLRRYISGVTNICVSILTTIASNNGLSHGRRQAIIWTNAVIVNWTDGNRLQWNINRNPFMFIQENTFEYVVWKMASILSPLQCVNTSSGVFMGNTYQHVFYIYILWFLEISIYRFFIFSFCLVY